jgi:hypothetical protein
VAGNPRRVRVLGSLVPLELRAQHQLGLVRP